MDHIKLNKKECNYIDLARVIGIYLVVLGHFPYLPEDVIHKNMIYAFHMPLFFVISGLLYKQMPLSIDSIKKDIISLVIPFIIYNAVFFILSIPVDRGEPLRMIKNTVLGYGEANPASWFFMALFGVRMLALLGTSKLKYILICIVCLILLVVEDMMNIPYPEYNIFKIRAILTAFPFFVFGFFVKDIANIEIKKIFKIGIILVSALYIYWFTHQFGRVNLGTGQYTHLAAFYAAGFLGSIGIIYIAQLLIKAVKSDFIKTISRGTMMIVGLHCLLTGLAKRYTPEIPFALSAVLALIITLGFYIPIKLTYNKFPILFGKTKK